ncbi:MAG TPA: hypothetical protein ENK18_00725 [Deltaproteobacteria bacterium]|nr:hypothetical protein [Deltaproteobacteria bacterium]
MIFVLSVAASGAEPFRAPIEEISHPRYEDGAHRPVAWGEVRSLARGSEAARRVRARRLGRTVLRVTFAGVTGLEVAATWSLARDDNFAALPLGAQAGMTGLCAVLLWTSLPQQRLEDRALLLHGANQVLVQP